MTSPYRENERKEEANETVWAKSFWWWLRRFQFARRHLGGHWERHWMPPGPHDDGYGEWSSWVQLDKCTEKYPGEFTPDTAGCPAYDQCEWWDCTECKKIGVSRHVAHHLHNGGSS